jgi:hypothetical protein
MPDLASTRLVDLHVLDDAEALALFTKIVGNERAAAEPEATAELLHACAGLPLAIRICAARLATRSGWTIRAMANRLRDEHRRLDELSAGDLSVRPSFQVSFTSLPASTDKQGIDPARAFCLLGLMQEPVISTSAAAALFGVPEYSAGDALEILVDTHLLESPAPDQYRIHNLLWVYAAERAAADLSAQERDDAIGRLRDWHDSERSGAGAEASRAPARSPHEPAPASNAILVGPAARAELRRVHAAATAAPAQIRTLDHLGTSAVRHPQPDALTEAMPDLLPSAQHHGGDPAAAHPPGGERPIREDQQRSTGRGAGGEVITVSQAGESPAGKMTPKAGPGGSMAGGGLPGNGGPPAEGETLLTTMRAVLAAHGILQREQVAAHYDALIRAWPETANHSPQVPAEERQGADWHTPPAHAEMIPDAPGHEQRPDPLTAKTAAEFVRTLAGFRQWAGDPTFREMERRCGHAVASATICTALGRDKDKLPSLRVVLAIVAACGGGEEQQRAYTTAWRKLRMAQEPKLPPERYQG